MARPVLCGPKEGIPIDSMLELGAHGPRFTADPSFTTQGQYLKWVADAGLKAVVTFDNDSFPLVDWNAPDWDGYVADQLEWYSEAWGALPHIINVWNEWKGTGGHEESPKPAHVVNRIAELTRQCFGKKQLIAHGSIVDGQPSSLEMLDWTHVNFADVHEYTKVAPNYFGAPGGEVLDLQKYRDVLPPHVGIIISEIGLSSDEAGEASQAVYLESIIRHCVSLTDLYLVSWFAYHPYNGWGLIRPDGSLKPAWYSYQRAAATYQHQEPEPEEPIMDMTEKQWEALWKTVEPNAIYRHGFGIEECWRNNLDVLGSPTQVDQQPGEWRAFSKNKIVQWTAQGAVILP